jgi:heme o synthase
MTEPAADALVIGSTDASTPRALRRRVGALVELTKPGITRLVVLTAAAGYYLASPGDVAWLRMLATLAGVALAAAGANALNQWMERDLDVRMRRTRLRPLPSGRLDAKTALAFGVGCCAAGVAWLLLVAGLAPAAVVATAAVSYVLVYTPLKTRTSLCTLVGAVPGALPILAGWTAAGLGIDVRAWILFWILFLWQIPHFLALAWMYREDYARSGFVMLSLGDDNGRMTGRQVLLYGLALLTASLLPTVLGLTGAVYFTGAFLLGLGLLALGSKLTLQCTGARARRLFLASVVYLPLLLALMVLDKA